jgi:hypothetical protein
LRADAAFPGECLPRAADGEVVVTCRDARGTRLRVVQIQASTGLVTEEISFTDDQPHVIIQFDDYRQVDTATLPFTVVIWYPERDMRMTVTVQGYEVNPALPGELFEVQE